MLGSYTPISVPYSLLYLASPRFINPNNKACIIGCKYGAYVFSPLFVLQFLNLVFLIKAHKYDLYQKYESNFLPVYTVNKLEKLIKVISRKLAGTGFGICLLLLFLKAFFIFFLFFYLLSASSGIVSCVVTAGTVT